MQKLIHISLLSTALFIAGCATHDTTQSNAVRAETQDAELINRSEVIAVVSSVDEAIALEQKAARWGYELKRKETLEGLVLYVMVFDCPPGIDPFVASEELERLQPKALVEVNHRYTIQSSLSTVPKFEPRDYANQLIQWPENGCEGYLKVGIIDGLVDVESKSLKASNIQSRSFLKTGIKQANAEHGTAVAELLVGTGRLTNTELYAASVVGVDADGASYSGVDNAVAHRPKT